MRNAKLWTGGPVQAREELVDVICRKEMGVYQQIFASTGETAALERTERRYNWLRKRLKAREEVRAHRIP